MRLLRLFDVKLRMCFVCCVNMMLFLLCMLSR